jgi:hypothetical protein
MKGYLQSTTIWGLLILALGWAAPRVGIDLAPGDAEQIVSTLIGVLGWSLALYGRSTASTTLSGLWARKAG